MFTQFIVAMLSGERGPSSKRGVMFWLLLLFTFMVIYDVFTGKHANPTYMDQVFDLLLVSMGIVFGEKFITAYITTRNQKSSTKTTIVAPPEATVVNTEVTKEPSKE